MKLSIVGLGVKNGDISVGALEAIKNAKNVILRTQNTPSATFLTDNGIGFIALDDVYLRSRNFDTLTKNLVKAVSSYLKDGDVCYLVDGAVSEDNSACQLIKKFPDATVFEGVSKAKWGLVKTGYFGGSYTATSAYDLQEFSAFSYPLVIFDLDSNQLASEWKLKLMDKIGEEVDVSLLIGDRVINTKLYEIDRFSGYDFSTALVIGGKSVLSKERFGFDDLYEIVELLRAPNGCPWDRVQTKESIRKNLIEECYELCDAIDQDDDDKMLEEIGDVMLQAVFHMIFAKERGAFTSSDVFSDECKKLIFRHSHIFGNDTAGDANGALDVWDKNKQIEKGFTSPSSYVSDVPKCFPSLLRAQKTLKRISKYSTEAVEIDLLCQLALTLLQKVCKTDDVKNLSGDVLLIVCLILQLLSVDAEEALYFSVDRLIKAFEGSENTFSLKAFFEGLVV